MSHWEFLLQKEGDQVWLPLESTNVEILEGRYRIVANTHIANTEIEIRVIHNSTEEVPPVRRVYRRSSRTRSQGLVSIIPFTRLKPGIWEFRCLAQLSTLSKETKQYIANLQVLPAEYDSPDFSQQLESKSQEVCIVTDSQTELKDSTPNENISFFPGQVDINEVKINQSRDIAKNNPEILTVEEIKSEEIELLDGEIQDESQALFATSERMENVTDFLDCDEQEKLNIQAHHQELKNINNQLKELTETPINDSSKLEQLQQEVAVKLNKEKDTSTNSQSSSTTNSHLELILDRVSYIAKPGEALIISGQITFDNQNQNIQSNESLNNLPLQNKNNFINKDSAITENNNPVVNGSLKICLRNPQTSGILIEVQQTLPEQVAPIMFACTINLPINIKTHLILGEIILIEHKNTLANKSFTITAPLENWLAAINDNLVEDEHQEIVTPKASLTAIEPEQKLNSFQKLVEKINQSQPDQKTEKEQFLPPQIFESITVESDSESLKLPTFGNSLPENVAKDAAQINNLLSKSNTPTDSESLKLPTFGNSLPENVAKDAAQINDLLAKSNTPTDPDEVDNVWEDSEWSEGQTSLALEEESDSETVNQEEEPETISNLVPFPTKFTPRKKEFKALKLEERFFSKAYSLINDSELSQWMKASSVPPTEKTDQDTELENISESKQKTDETDQDTELENILESKQKTEIEQLEDNDSVSVMGDDEEFARDNDDEINSEAQEFVVEDEQVEEILPNQDQQWNFGLDNISQEHDELIPRQSYIVRDEEPLPVPNLEVLAKDVIAGRSVKVRVKLPEGLPRIYVKIWVYDRQAQAVVAGPHWLTDFIPNGMGEIEVITELEIVYGCLEVRFEAIAVEMETKRESHKAAIEYLVAPPPPPNLPFDNLS